MNLEYKKHIRLRNTGKVCTKNTENISLDYKIKDCEPGYSCSIVRAAYISTHPPIPLAQHRRSYRH
jgi:hypothetical protein